MVLPNVHACYFFSVICGLSCASYSAVLYIYIHTLIVSTRCTPDASLGGNPGGLVRSSHRRTPTRKYNDVFFAAAEAGDTSTIVFLCYSVVVSVTAFAFLTSLDVAFLGGMLVMLVLGCRDWCLGAVWNNSASWHSVVGYKNIYGSRQ